MKKAVETLAVFILGMLAGVILLRSRTAHAAGYVYVDQANPVFGSAVAGAAGTITPRGTRIIGFSCGMELDTANQKIGPVCFVASQ